jgi:hypothetical protein
MSAIGFEAVAISRRDDGSYPPYKIRYFVRLPDGTEFVGDDEQGLKNLIARIHHYQIREDAQNVFVEIQEILSAAFNEGLEPNAVTIELEADVLFGWLIIATGIEKNQSMLFSSLEDFKTEIMSMIESDAFRATSPHP